MRTQFTDEELRAAVEEAHALGLPVTAHAHGTPAVRQALDAGVDGIEHCTCVTERGFGDCDDDLVDRLASSGVVVCPTIGADRSRFPVPPPPLQAMAESLGTTVPDLMRDRWAFVGRLHAAGVRIVSGVDSGIQPAKGHGTLPVAVEELVEGGLTVAEAVATATSQAALACGLAGTTGRLAAGLAADLVVVDGDLSADVAALRRTAAVVLRGQPLT
jgi:imidazolonepropionase-like amidohydrolase